MKIRIMLMLTLAFAVLAGCQKESENAVKPEAEPVKILKEGVEDPCYEQSYVIYGGQTIEVGTLYVANDEDEIFVTYDLSGTDWYLDETHVFVGNATDLPLNGGGNPKIGNFPYSMTHSMEQVYTYTFLRSDFEDCFAVAAHAVVVQVDENGNQISEETAWADGGTEFPGKRWGWYVAEFCSEDCEPENLCNGAFAYFYTSADYPTITSTCFSEYGFSTTGWTIGPVDAINILYNPAPCPEADLIACVSSCNPDEGLKIGNVVIEGFTFRGEFLRVNFVNIPAGYGLEETYVYVGSDPLPMVNGNYSVDPEDFNYSHQNLNGATSDMHLIPTNGEVYVIAYAVISQQ